MNMDFYTCFLSIGTCYVHYWYLLTLALTTMLSHTSRQVGSFAPYPARKLGSSHIASSEEVVGARV